MDMVECCIRNTTGQKEFRLDHCIEAIEASVDVRANRKKTFYSNKAIQLCIKRTRKGVQKDAFSGDI